MRSCYVTGSIPADCREWRDFVCSSNDCNSSPETAVWEPDKLIHRLTSDYFSKGLFESTKRNHRKNSNGENSERLMLSVFGFFSSEAHLPKFLVTSNQMKVYCFIQRLFKDVEILPARTLIFFQLNQCTFLIFQSTFCDKNNIIV